MNLRKLLRSFLCLALFNFLLPAMASRAQTQTTPFKELARKIVAARTDDERNLLLEQNKDLRTPDLRRAISQEASSLRVEGNYEKALEVDRFTRQYAERTGDRAGLAAALNNIGVNYQETGQYKTAVEYFKLSLERKAALDDRAGIASSSNNVGLSYINLGEYRLAQRYLEDSLKIYQSLDRKDALPVPLNNLGIIQRRLGNAERAADYYGQSLKLCEETKNKYCAAQALSNLGILKSEAGDYDAALELHLKSLALREELKNKDGVSISLSNIGAVRLLQNDFPQALALFEKKLKIAEEIKVQDSAATALAGITLVKLKTRRYVEALESADRALAIAAKIEDEELLWNIYKIRGSVYRRTGEPQKARAALDASIKLIEARRSQLTAGGSAGHNYFSNKIDPYHEAIGLAHESGDYAAALNYAERAKARALLDVLSSQAVGAASGKTMTAAEKSREDEIRRRISLLNAQVMRERAKTPKPDSSRLESLEKELAKARSDDEVFRADLYAAHPELRAQRGEAQIITPPEIADSLLAEPGTALLEYAVTNEATYLFVITKPRTRSSTAGSPIEVKIHKIAVSQEELTRRTEDFRKSIAAKDEYQKLGQELYNLLVAPARPQLAGKTKLIVVPDAALWGLPFQALVTGRRDRFLLEDYALSYAPSLTALREMRKIARKRAAGPANSKTLLAFGNPAFAPQEATAAGETFERETPAALPDAEKEVNSLSALYGSTRSRVYVKSEAREDRAKGESGGFRVLQFATHGVFNDANPLYSYLLLSPSAAAGDDGLLEARELMNLDLSADLVVLSACETARGRVSAGEGLTGMTWALFVAGVPSTVASQWKVPSAGTTEIMLNFHRNLLKKGGDKAEALRRAELEHLRNGAFRHPFYWAGFVLVGND